MAFMFHRGLAIPLWTVAAGAVALTTLPRVMPTVLALLGIAAVGWTMPALVRRRHAASSAPDVLPAVDRDPARPARILVARGMRTRTLDDPIDAQHARGRIQKADEAAALVRMDDDGGRLRSEQ